jgi:hypothetical protein
MSSFEHISLYRKRAAEMEMLAAETRFPRMRESYLRLAEEWNLLAESLERQARGAGWPSEARHRSERH